MATLYGNFPLLLPGMTQSMSRNGLQKTSGTILCEPGQESEAYSMAQEYGSVFPDMTTRTTDMGLVEVTFEAYQATGIPTSVRGSLALTLTKSYTGTYTTAGNSTAETTWTVIENWIVDTYTTFTTLAASSGSNAITSTVPLLNKSMKRRRTIGRVGSGGASALTISWLTELASVSRRNFGDIDEIDLTYSQTPTIS